MATKKLYDSIKIDIDTKALDKAQTGLHELASTINEDVSFENANEQINELVESLTKSVEEGANLQQVTNEISKGTQDALAALEKQSQKLSHSLTEDGKKERARLEEINSLLEQGNLPARERNKLEKEKVKLSSKVILGTDEELKKRKIEALALKQRVKTLNQEIKINKTLKTLIKDDLKSIKQKIDAQKKFIKELNKTEFAYKAIKKAIPKIAKMAAVGAGAVGAGAIGAVGAVVGGALQGAERFAELDKQANAVKLNIPQDAKVELLRQLYVQTGADFESIKTVLNRLARTGLNTDEIKSIAAGCVQNPSLIELATMQTGGANIDAFSRLINASRSASNSNEQFAQASQRALNRTRRTYQKATVNEVVSLDAELSTVLDDEQRERVLRRVINGYNKSSAKNLQEYLKGIDVNKLTSDKRLTKFDFSKISDTGETTTYKKSKAEKAVEEAREFEMKKDVFLQKVLKLIMRMFEGKEDMIDKIFGFIEQLVGLVDKLYKKIVGDKPKEERKFKEEERKFSGNAHANGGLITKPSLVGEYGLPELVIPTRNIGRSVSISQTFNLNNNPSTLSLAAACNSAQFRGMIR